MTLGIGETGEETDKDVFSGTPPSSVNVMMAKWEQCLKGNEGLILEAKKISFLFSPELSSSAVMDEEGPLNILPEE